MALTTSTRLRIIESLNYPRYVVGNQLDTDECPQHGHYSRASPMCQQCVEEYECAWLFHNDELSGLSLKPDEELVRSLDFGVQYVSGLSIRDGHNPNECKCESCSWLRTARDLLTTATGKETL
jgi:hypothetical protein